MNQTLEIAQLWEPGVPGIELFSARLFHHSFAKHMHEAYTIGINDGGQGCFRYQGEARCAYPQSFNLLSPGEVHTGQAASSNGWIYRNIYISVPLIKQLLVQLEWQWQGLPYFLEPVVWDQPLQSAFHRLFQGLEKQIPLLEQQSLMLGVLSHLFVNYAEPRYYPRSIKPETKAIALVRAYLEAHYTEEISIETLAQLVGLNPYYLIRNFHQQIGLPPHAYQRHWQLQQVKQALRTAKPLSEVAIEHGFYDQSHLNRYFKRVFGVTPGQYRRVNSVQDA